MGAFRWRASGGCWSGWTRRRWTLRRNRHTFISRSFFLLCFATEARAGPWQAHPVPATLPAGENPGSDLDIGSAADYIKTLNRAVPISGIGMYVRDGRTELIDGHEVKRRGSD
jgi:hypothetical protein